MVFGKFSIKITTVEKESAIFFDYKIRLKINRINSG